MKGRVSIFFLVVLISQAYSSQDQTPKINFRDASWGMTMEEVIKIEGKQPEEKHKSNSGLDIIDYSGKAGNLDCLYAYFFAENKLVQGKYVFLESHVNKNNYLDDFDTVKNSLAEKYGKPTEDHKVWRNDLYKDNPSEWGMAVSAGHLVCEAVWVLEDTEILLQLTGDNFKVTHGLIYTSTIKEYVELIKKAEEKAKKGIW